MPAYISISGSFGLAGKVAIRVLLVVSVLYPEVNNEQAISATGINPVVKQNRATVI